MTPDTKRSFFKGSYLNAELLELTKNRRKCENIQSDTNYKTFPEHSHLHLISWIGVSCGRSAPVHRSSQETGNRRSHSDKHMTQNGSREMSLTQAQVIYCKVSKL